MKIGRQQATGSQPKARRRISWLGIRVLGTWPLVTWAQSTNDIPPLRPPHAEIPPTFWEQHAVSVGMGGFALLAFIGLAIWFAMRPRPPVIVPPEIQARGDLAALRKLPEDGRVLSRISQTVRRYFGTAFSLPPGELTTTEFCQAIAANGQIPSELANVTGDFLRRCDERKFAPDAPATTGTANDAMKLIDQAETHREQLRRVAPANPKVIVKT
jgi:hypothetical protein